MKVNCHHVAVSLGGGRPTDPGLLIEWRQKDGNWQGRVITLSGDPYGGPRETLTMYWVDAQFISPVRMN